MRDLDLQAQHQTRYLKAGNWVNVTGPDLGNEGVTLQIAKSQPKHVKSLLASKFLENREYGWSEKSTSRAIAIMRDKNAAQHTVDGQVSYSSLIRAGITGLRAAMRMTPACATLRHVSPCIGTDTCRNVCNAIVDRP